MVVHIEKPNGKRVPALILTWWVVMITSLGVVGTLFVGLYRLGTAECDIRQNRNDIEIIRADISEVQVITAETRIDVGWIRSAMEREYQQ